MREQIKIYSKERDGKVICVCLASNKLCNRQCDTEMASLDEYEEISECFKNKGNKNYEKAL